MAVNRRSELLGINYDVVTRAQILERVTTAMLGEHVSVLNHVNIHAMNLAWGDPEMTTILNHSDFVFVDGVGIRWGSICAGLGGQVGERSTSRDFIEDLFEICGERQLPVYHLGDTEDVNADFTEKLSKEHPDCPLAGCHHGFFDQHGPENDRLIELINNSGAKLLLLGMSMPVQEKWAWRNRERLRVPAVLSVGGLMRIYTGATARGPKWMTDNGMEWVFRLAVQRRLVWRRYVLGNPLFLWRCFCSRFKKPV